MIEIPEFTSKVQLYDFLYENKDLHIKSKKSEMKKADAYNILVPSMTIKGAHINLSDSDELLVKSIINTTNVLDSHDDVHIKGIWNKSLKETKDRMLLQEHVMSFKNVISKQVKGYAINYNWSELGYPKLKGETQALEYHSVVKVSQNEFMHDQYAKGHVDNHSVGMVYVKLFLAVNNDSSEYKDEYETFNKYIDGIVNQQKALDRGFFWAIKEAKDIEGSAVVKGSNILTPTTSVEPKSEPPASTHKDEPPHGTRPMHKSIHFLNN